MTESNEASSPSGLLNPEHYADYFVRNRAEIMLMLRRMQDHRVLLNVFIDGGPHRFVSAVLEAGSRGLVLDASPDKFISTHTLAADVLTCTAQLDGVRVQFDVRDIRGVTYDKLPAIQTQLPEAMLRLQRRETYRLAVPLHTPVGCVVTFVPKAPEDPPEGAPPPEPVTTRPRVVDISMDGIALLFQGEELPLSVGMELPDCLIALPESDSARLRLRVRNLHHTTNPNGVRSVRAGCQMLNVPARFTQQIQRYIFKIERERRLMESDD